MKERSHICNGICECKNRIKDYPKLFYYQGKQGQLLNAIVHIWIYM